MLDCGKWQPPSFSHQSVHIKLPCPLTTTQAMHLLKLMRGAPAGGDTRRIISPFVCEGRPFHCFPWIHQQLDSTGRRHHGCDQLLSDVSLRRKTNDDKSFVSHQTCALTGGILRPDGPETASAHACNFIVLRRAGNLVSLILTLTAFCRCSICMLLWNHMPLLMQLARCCVSLMP